MTPMNGNYVKMKKRHKNKCKLINIEKNEVKYEDLFVQEYMKIRDNLMKASDGFTYETN